MAKQPPPGETPQQPPTQTPAPDAAAPVPAAAADNAPMSKEAVDDLLKQAKGIEGVQAAASPAPEAAAATAPTTAAPAAADAGSMSQESIDELLKQANFDSPDAGDAHGNIGRDLEHLLKVEGRAGRLAHAAEGMRLAALFLAHWLRTHSAPEAIALAASSGRR